MANPKDVFTGIDLGMVLSSVAKDMMGRAERALRTEAEIEMTEAKKRTPVASGALRSSGQVQMMRDPNGDVVAVLSFGDTSVGYALPVHENLEALHKVGQAKYLESVVVESAPFMAQRIADRMKK